MPEWDPKTIEPLIEGLSSEDSFERLSAIQKLEEITKQTLGFRFNDLDENREQAVRRWKDWWKEQQRDEERKSQLRTVVKLSGGVLDMEALKKAIQEIPPEKIQGYLNALMMKLKVQEIKCESCGVRPASVTVTEKHGKGFVSKSLCDVCARERGDLLN